MAEAEDVITDAARHATIYAQNLWRRHRSGQAEDTPLALNDVIPRLDLLLEAAFGRSFTIRTAQTPARATVLARLLRRQDLPASHEAIGSTDGTRLWLPATLPEADSEPATMARFRLLALRQAVRASRGSATWFPIEAPALVRDLYRLLEAHAGDSVLARMLPGTATPLASLGQDALIRRPSLNDFPASKQPFERCVRELMTAPLERPVDLARLFALPGLVPMTACVTPAQTLAFAESIYDSWLSGSSAMTNAAVSRPWLWPDQWTGELRAPKQLERGGSLSACNPESDEQIDSATRSARLERRPEVREAKDDEDDQSPGAWMVQTAAPHEMAEDPMGLSRPTDRDADTAAEDFADALSEVPEARLVSTPGKAREYLLSDDSPDPRARAEIIPININAADSLNYPEWNWRSGTYQYPGATVLLRSANCGSQQWVDDTLAKRAPMLHEIRRRFELLRSVRTRYYRQHDGDNIDLAAYVESLAAYRAGLPLEQRLYSNERRNRRDLAVLLLVDISGSTDSLVSGGKRIIDVEREALLLVCLALDGLNTPYSVQAFSGEGPRAVTVRSVKSFSEPYSDQIALKIAGLEPENYTRAGAALRHATALLMREPSERRLLLMLSDGKPNDIDDYEGRTGVEDMRQAVQEASLQGIAPFCLTVDRQAANYMPFIFGPHRYALLHQPELLPTVLLDWLRRLLV
ncbi:nitric oxide reductase activation protein NorD [Granulosicoccus antarcticus]|uniref:VWFA domain-containing protein n=1 Tax=Granulosicoccus antarcticus IMCC3135 TaxID=1192854 RepID=A0A2Z2NU86_9GAMM|nr:VWA domain-containing protein [Granulosicoccus antarcticus]ASJ73601.1 hypothetical protein IMCC3135_17610 [Granulosicoccus antarcticus IMCC3135]